MPEALVSSVYGLYYTVDYEDKSINCFLQGKLKRNKRFHGFTNPVAVGDRVLFDYTEDGQGLIYDVVERKNSFTRKEKGRSSKEDIIAANLDRILVIQSIFDPQINLRFVDRIAVRASFSKIPVVLCINKIDLASKDHKKYIDDYYKNSGLDYIYVSAINSINIKKLFKTISSGRTLLIGQSGVGKTTLINSIFPDLNLKTNEVSENTGKGRHTTTNVNLYRTGNAELIDTPGVREFGLMGIESHLLSDYFYEFSDYKGKCNFKTCTHDHEPNCYIKRLVDESKIYEGRYISYLNILESISQRGYWK